jgi:uncharacterized protein
MRSERHPAEHDDETERKVARLRDPATYGLHDGEVEAVETHMSWVFLVGDRAYKLKKPVRFPFLDFSTLEARERNCKAELTLNRRLAPDVYLRVAPLTRARSDFDIDGGGPIADWLVVMRRLPADRMLDRVLVAGALPVDEQKRLATRLADFYRSADHPKVSPAGYTDRLAAEQAVNAEILSKRDFAVDHGRAPTCLARMDRALLRHRPLLETRAAQGALVDGHGDLRPEHICLEDGIAIFDCLEFSAELRTVDPVDELAYLGVECALIGAPKLGPDLFERVMRAMALETDWPLFHLHAARRAVLRARLALAHLLDPAPRTPDKWEPLAARYLALAELALDRLGCS